MPSAVPALELSLASRIAARRQDSARRRSENAPAAAPACTTVSDEVLINKQANVPAARPPLEGRPLSDRNRPAPLATPLAEAKPAIKKRGKPNALSSVALSAMADKLEARADRAELVSDGSENKTPAMAKNANIVAVSRRRRHSLGPRSLGWRVSHAPAAAARYRQRAEQARRVAEAAEMIEEAQSRLSALKQAPTDPLKEAEALVQAKTCALLSKSFTMLHTALLKAIEEDAAVERADRQLAARSSSDGGAEPKISNNQLNGVALARRC